MGVVRIKDISYTAKLAQNQHIDAQYVSFPFLRENTMFYKVNKRLNK